jgi:hypothetical protein
LFLSVYEDADLFRRFVLAGYELVQSWDSLVYHLTCRGGQFSGATKMEDFKKKDENWLRNNQISMLEYVRKWGGMFKEYGPCEPRPNIKYDIGLKVTNARHIPEILGYEPYFNSMQVDIDTQKYIESAQLNSKFDIKAKFVEELTNDIIVELDCSSKTQLESFNYAIQNIEDLLSSTEPNETYQLANDGILLTIKVKDKIPQNIKIDLW